jgi:hypothetical protein
LTWSGSIAARAPGAAATPREASACGSSSSNRSGRFDGSNVTTMTVPSTINVNPSCGVMLVARRSPGRVT